MWYRGVCAGKLVVVNCQDARVIIGFGAEVIRLVQRQMAPVAVVLGTGRIIKTRHAVSRHTTQVVAVVVILTSQPLVGIQLHRQMYLVAGSAEFRRFMQRFQKGSFMKIRLRFYQCTIDPLQELASRVRKRVVQRLFDGVIGVAFRSVDICDRMTTSASDASLCRRVVDIVKSRVVKCSAEKRYRVMATCTEPGPLNGAIAFEHGLASISHRKQVRGIIE